MPTITKFDNANKLKSIPYKDYFGAMQLSKAQLKERIALAEDIEDAMLVLFALYPHYLDDIDGFKSEMIKDLTEVVADYVVIDNEISNHIEKIADEVADATQRHSDYGLNSKKVADSPTKNEITDDRQGNGQASNDNQKNYWLSSDRAIIIAENEANTICNHSDYAEAVSYGYTKKTWLTMLDDKVRDTHIYLEGETIDIDDVFIVGSSMMRYPKDTEYGASADEIINCRCVCTYSK